MLAGEGLKRDVILHVTDADNGISVRQQRAELLQVGIISKVSSSA